MLAVDFQAWDEEYCNDVTGTLLIPHRTVVLNSPLQLDIWPYVELEAKLGSHKSDLGVYDGVKLLATPAPATSSTPAKAISSL